MQYGCVDLMSFLTRVCTDSRLRSHGSPVAGSFVVRSRLHPGRSVVPPNFLPLASWQTLGCENISHTSGPLRSKSSSAFFKVSSILMSSGFSRYLLSLASVVSSTMHSSMSFPVDRLHTLREWTSPRHGPPLDVVVSRSAWGNVREYTPDPMSIHCRSLALISLVLTFGPGWLPMLSTATSSASAVAAPRGTNVGGGGA